MFFRRGYVVKWYHNWGSDQKLHLDLNDRISMRGELQMSILVCYVVFSIGVLLFLPLVFAAHSTTPTLPALVIGFLSAIFGTILSMTMIMTCNDFMNEMKITPYENLIIVKADQSSFDALVEFCKTSTKRKWKAFAVIVPITHHKDEVQHGAFSFMDETDAAMFKLHFG